MAFYNYKHTPDKVKNILSPVVFFRTSEETTNAPYLQRPTRHLVKHDPVRER